VIGLAGRWKKGSQCFDELSMNGTTLTISKYLRSS
jgi:hypothetical protein